MISAQLFSMPPMPLSFAKESPLCWLPSFDGPAKIRPANPPSAYGCSWNLMDVPMLFQCLDKWDGPHLWPSTEASRKDWKFFSGNLGSTGSLQTVDAPRTHRYSNHLSVADNTDVSWATIRNPWPKKRIRKCNKEHDLWFLWTKEN